MGWQDAPMANAGGGGKAAWESAPLVASATTTKPKTQSDFLREELQKGSWPSRNLAGVGAAMISGVEGLKGIFGMSDPEAVEAARVTQEEAPVGGLVGSMAMLAPTALIPGVNTVTGAAVVGGLSNAALIPGSLKDRAKSAAMGMVGGGVGQGVSNAIAKAAPYVVSGAKKLLQKEGVGLTPGQFAGGTLKSFEDKATSIPFLGNIIDSARHRGVVELDAAAIKRATLPGMVVKGTGHEAIKELRLGLSEAYDNVLAKSSVDGFDQTFVTNMKTLNDLVQELPAKEAGAFRNAINREIVQRMAPNGKLNAGALQEVTAGLRNKADTFAKSNDGYQRQLGEALKEAGAEFRGLIERTNPDNAAELGAINKAYANFKRIQKAGSLTGSENGVFTPAQLHSSIRAMDKTKDKRAFSEGTALLQDLSGAGKDIMPSKVGDSGTAGRLLNNIFSLHGLTTSIGGAAAAAPAYLLYSRSGSAAFNKLVSATGMTTNTLSDLAASNPNALRILATAATKKNPSKQDLKGLNELAAPQQ